MLSLMPVPNLPDIVPGADLPALIGAGFAAADIGLQSGDVIAVAQKIVSKAEDRYVDLATVTPTSEAEQLAAETGKDARLVTLILQESDSVSRYRKGVLIVRHRLGFVCANAGIDRSNTGRAEDVVLLLPVDPDDSAEKIRQAIQTQFGVDVAVIITDSHGRPHRLGTVGVAIGVAGMAALWDRRGEHDRYGRELQVTEVAIADEIAAATSLLMGQADEGQPVILLRGLGYKSDNGTLQQLIRPKQYDLYR